MTRACSARRFDLGVPHRVVERKAVDEQDGLCRAAVDVGEVAGGDGDGVHGDGAAVELNRKRCDAAMQASLWLLRLHVFAVAAFFSASVFSKSASCRCMTCM